MSIGKKKQGSQFEEINTQDFLGKLKSAGKEKNLAFRELVGMTHKPLTYFIRRYISSMEEAQEVLQEVYLGIHKSLDNFEGKSKLSTWIYSLAHYKICDKISDRSWQHQEFKNFNENKIAELKGDFQLSKSSEWETSSDRLLMLKTVQKNIPGAIETLSPNLKDVYILRDVEGMGSQETAQILNISEESVRVRLHRARNTIVENLKRNFSLKQSPLQAVEEKK